MKQYLTQKTLLVTSLIANAFLVGLLLSSCPLMDKPGGGRAGFERMERAAHALPPADRTKVESILANNREGMDSRPKVMGENFAKMAALLTAPKLDEAKLKALHRQIRGYDEESKGKGFAMMLTIAKALPDEERIKFFKASMPERKPK